MTNPARKALMDMANRVAREPFVSRRKGTYVNILGSTTALGFHEYVVHLFHMNEELPEDWPKPLTDLQLKAMILREFHDSPKTVASFVNGVNNPSRMRTYYRQGKLLSRSYPPDDPGYPPRLSLRYGVLGLPIRMLGQREELLTNAELIALHRKFPRTRESLEDLFVRLKRKKNDKGEYPLEWTA